MKVRQSLTQTFLSFLFKDTSTESFQPLQKYPLVSSVSEKLKEIKKHWFERWKLKGRWLIHPRRARGIPKHLFRKVLLGFLWARKPGRITLSIWQGTTLWRATFSKFRNKRKSCPRADCCTLCWAKPQITASKPGLSLLEGTRRHRLLFSRNALPEACGLPDSSWRRANHSLQLEKLLPTALLRSWLRIPGSAGQYHSLSSLIPANAVPFWKDHRG